MTLLDISFQPNQHRAVLLSGMFVVPVSRHTALALAWPTLQVCGQIMTSSGKTRRKRQRRSDSSDESDFLQADTPDSALAAIDQAHKTIHWQS